MKHLTAQLRLISLLSLILSSWTAAYAQITPSADSYTVTGDPTTNYGAKTLLDVESPTQTTYIQFNLSSIPSTYTSNDITKATLKLYVFSVTTPGSFNVDYVNGTWAENTITSNLAPALGTTIAASIPLVTADKNQFILIDVTEALQAWLSGTPNDGIALVGNSPFNATFESKENTTTSHAPELDIVFAGGGTLTGVTTASGSGLTGGGTSGTLNLGLLTTCASGQVLEWNGSGWACATAVGSGTVTKVASGAGLTGGPITGSGTLSIAPGGVTNAMLATSYAQLGVANTFTGNETVNGIVTASSSAFGVTGTATTTSGIGVGVAGTAATPSGYGIEGLNTAAGGGIGVYGSSAAAAGYGVEGVNTSGGGTGVYGTAGQFGVYGVATASSGSTVGVFGSGVDGLQGSGTSHGVYAAGTGTGSTGVYGTSPSYGLYGVATNTTGSSFGVYGSGGSNGVYGTAPNFGLYGVATATSGNSVGVFGSGIDGLQGSGSAYGVYGAASASGSTGVYGTAPQFGLYGLATGSGNTVGVFGSGVDGLQGGGTIHGVYANGGQYGVYALTPGGTAGTYGVYHGASALGGTLPVTVCVEGCGDSVSRSILIPAKAAVWADTNNDGDANNPDVEIPALLATADANIAAAFLNNSNITPAFLAYNKGSGGTSPQLKGGTVPAIALQAGGPAGTCTISGSGDTACTGAMKSVVATAGSAGAQRVETYTVQSAENWFEDAGTAQILNGTGRVNLESIFGQTVNTGVEYHVFLTPDGDCKGLYVSTKTASGFEVRELGGGSSSIAFEYRIMAKRIGYENVRLTNVTERFERQQAQGKKMQRPVRSSAQPQSSPTLPALSSAEMQSAPQMPTTPVLPSGAQQREPVTSKPILQSPVRAAVKPLAAQPK